MSEFRQAFHDQADACTNLDSDFTAMLLRVIGDNLAEDHPVGKFLHDWPDYQTFRSGAVALRLAGALNSLVLLDMDVGLTAQYPPNSTTPPTLWTAVDTAMRAHHDHLISWMDSPPQTNEIRRSNALIPAFHIIAQETGLPLVLSEIGASAGLNLNWDKYAMEINGQVWGPKTAEVRLSPDWTGPLPPLANIDVLQREGCDLNPLDPENPQHCLRLMSYIWPDQSLRIANTRRALELARETDHHVRREDAIAFLKRRLAPQIGVTRVIYHTIMWQYLTSEDQTKGEAMIRAAGAEATPDSPLAWLNAEADDLKLDGAAITLTLWPTGETRTLGRVDFHGRWVKWN